MASQYVKRGVIRVATDLSMTVVLSNPESQFRAALIDLLEDVAAGIIAGNPTVIAAAEAAVANALASQRIVQSRIVAPSGGTWTDLNAVNPTLPVVLDVRAGALNRPVSLAFTGWHIPSGASDAVQMLVAAVSPPQQWMRAKTGGVWGAWLRVTDQVRCVHFESGVPVYDGPLGPLATHYILPDHTGQQVIRPTPFPTPLATPAFDW